jgi:plasmid stability protein
MAALTIRNVDDATKAALRVRAARHGVSMEEEVRRILREAVVPAPPTQPMGQQLLRRFSGVTAEGFSLPERQPPRAPPVLG